MGIVMEIFNRGIKSRSPAKGLWFVDTSMGTVRYHINMVILCGKGTVL